MTNRTPKQIAVLTTTLIVCILLSFFSVLRYLIGDVLISIIEAILAFSSLCAYVYTYKTGKTKFVLYAIGPFALTAFTLVVYFQGSHLIYWVFPAQLVSFYLFRLKGALLFSLSGYIICFSFLYGSSSLSELLTFAGAYVCTSLFAASSSKTFQLRNRELNINQRLNTYRNNILEQIVKSTPLNEVLLSIVEASENEFDGIMCSILLLDKETQQLGNGIAPSLPNFYNEAINGTIIGQGVGSCGTAAFTGKRVIVEDISTHPYWAPWTELTAKAELGSCWSEPIIDSKKQVVGTFAIYHKDKATPTENHLRFIELFTSIASIAIEKESDAKLIWRQANFDSLTNLPNRNMMQEHLQIAIKTNKRSNKKLAVIFIDIDHFKDINDTLGHEIGDLLLVEAAKRIQSCIRENDTVARLGGDEFILIINDLDDHQSAERIVQSVQQVLSTPYQLKEEVVHSSASIGITFYPDDADNIKSLLGNADQAMYGAKEQGRNNYHYFTDEMRESALTRMNLIKALRNALSNNEFHLVYQPIMDCNTSVINKAEVLIRWQHPIEGLVNPAKFIPLAEETGLIIEISDWIFEEVINQVKKWREKYNPNFQVSINTSPIQYKENDGNILNWLERIKESDLPSDAICLEITENLLMESHQSLEDILNQVKAANVEISIDDFGTGYSSFSYLREFQTSYVKIDRSFVQKMSEGSGDLALCEAIVVMAKKLNIKVIAEGIETEEQKSLLKEIGCDYGQGYLLSKPVEANEFEQLLRNE